MHKMFIEKIKAHAMSLATELPFAATSVDAIKRTEGKLGFSIPTLLKECYLGIGNGGFGPGYGIIGVEGGYASDYGNIVETYEQLKRDQELEGQEWPLALLPFCEWGCNIFSCVDCKDDQHMVYMFEDFAVRSQKYRLSDFFELWICGVDILSYNGSGVEGRQITNPFTGTRETVWKRRKK